MSVYEAFIAHSVYFASRATFQAANVYSAFFVSFRILFNPILTGGGGGVNLTPLHEIRDCLATAADRDTPFRDFFLSSLTHLLLPSLRKSDHRSRGHVTICTRTLAQNLPKICILHMFVYKTHYRFS